MDKILPPVSGTVYFLWSYLSLVVASKKTYHTTFALDLGLSSMLFVWVKTPSSKNGEHEVICECGECFTALRDVDLLLYLSLTYSIELVPPRTTDDLHVVWMSGTSNSRALSSATRLPSIELLKTQGIKLKLAELHVHPTIRCILLLIVFT